MRDLLGLYLEFSLLTMTNESVRKQMTQTGNSVINLIDDQVQRNIKVFETMLSAFSTDSGQTQPEQRPK